MGWRKGHWTRRQRRFVEEYVIDSNGTQAAIRAGFSPASAGVIACKLLKKAKIKRAIKEKFAVISAHAQLTAERVKSELACMAFVNAVEVMSAEDLRNLPESVQRSITGFKIRREIKKEVRDGEEVDVPYEVIEVKFAKEGAIRDAMRYLGLLVDRTKHEGSVDGGAIKGIEIGESKREGG